MFKRFVNKLIPFFNSQFLPHLSLELMDKSQSRTCEIHTHLIKKNPLNYVEIFLWILFNIAWVAGKSGQNEVHSIGWLPIKKVNKSKRANQNKYVEN